MTSFAPKIITVIVFIFICFIIPMILTYPIHKVIKFCERDRWNSTLYDSGIKVVFDKETVKVKCNKVDETDAIIQVVETLWFWDKSK